MGRKTMRKHFAFYIIIIAAAVITRLIPHAWNFAPVTAIAIFAAIYLPTRQAIALPLAIRFISDAVIGFFSWPLMIAVYLAHLFGVAMGLWIRGNKSVGRVIAAPIVSAIVFFLVTNFAWLYTGYSNDLAGIMLAYTNGLPFLRGTLLGDVSYTLALVGGYELVMYYKFKVRSKNFKITI